MTDTDIVPLDNGEMDEISRAAALEASKLASRPLIDHLADAVAKDDMGNLVLEAKAGDKIIIERFASVLSHRPWLDTRTYIIESVDGVTGDLRLFDPDMNQEAMSNYITGTQRGYRFKLPNSKGLNIGQRKRGRPKKNPTGVPEEVKPVQLDANGQPIKKKRGRPPGSKNRDRDTIVAEKKAKIDRRKTKKGARE